VRRLSTDLESKGFSIIPEFMSVASLRADLQRLRLEGRFHPAGIGRGSELHTNAQVRRDEISWLERADGTVPELWQKLEEVRTEINRELFMGLVDFEGHYARYPSGGFYQRHRDSFRLVSSRVISVVLYLNEGWKEEDGGRLRVYAGENGFTDIDPVGGTLVCFLSCQTEHEVLPSTRERLSLAGWFKQRSKSRP
jgi:SM-20-related protein